MRTTASIALVGFLVVTGCGGSDDDTAPAATSTTIISSSASSSPATVTTQTEPPATNGGSNGGNNSGNNGGSTDTTAATGPAVLTVQAPSEYICNTEAPGFPPSGMLTLKWTTERATSVNIAIDSPTGIYQSNQPASGSLSVPAPCTGDTQTYYVIAVGLGGATATKSATTTGK